MTNVDTVSLFTMLLSAQLEGKRAPQTSFLWLSTVHLSYLWQSCMKELSRGNLLEQSKSSVPFHICLYGKNMVTTFKTHGRLSVLLFQMHSNLLPWTLTVMNNITSILAANFKS